jgi:hypothetical protein
VADVAQFLTGATASAIRALARARVSPHNDVRMKAGTSRAPVGRLGPILIPAACLFLASCGGDSSQTLDDAHVSVRSWCSTLATAGHQWEQRRVPALYVRQTVDAARKSLGEQKKKLEKAPSEPRRFEVTLEMERLERRLDEMSDAVRRKDPAAAGVVGEALRAELNTIPPSPT